MNSLLSNILIVLNTVLLYCFCNEYQIIFKMRNKVVIKSNCHNVIISDIRCPLCHLHLRNLITT